MTTQTCNPDFIDDFLADRLTEDEQSRFEHHLDVCDDCCSELHRRTATMRLWDEARAYLSSTENLVATGDPAHTTTGQPVASAGMLRLDFLAPTDDPHMLGRFAGYEISAVIGCGGMGIVLKGFDVALNRYSAIKVLAPHYASSGAARQRFSRESQAAAAVVHDNVIAIHGVDEFNGLPYLVMPYVKGESLQKRLNRDGILSTAEILRIAMQTARGLAAAHDQGLVHRDIKPGNILLPENVERVIITDFGLARAADDASLTRSGVIAGTPQYMSPEQARGDGIDTRSDLFSLGSVIYAMCTGHPPFRAETPYGILRRITDNAPRPIRDVNPDAPDWLCGIVDRLLQKDPSKRFGSANEVAHLLEDCLAHVQQPTRVPLPEGVPGRHPVRRLQHFALLTLLVVAGFAAWFFFFDETAVLDGQVANGENVAPMKDSGFKSGTSLKAIPNGESTSVDLAWDEDNEIDQLQKSLQQLRAELTEPDEIEP